MNVKPAAAAIGRASLPQRLFQSWMLLCALAAMSCPAGEDLLAVYHFTALVPPSNMLTVGSILAIEDDADDDIQTSKLKLVCGPRASLGSHFVPLQTETIGQSIKQNIKSTWKLQGEALSHIKATASGSNVESVTANLVNAKILALSDADVLENLGNRSEDCQRAIRARLTQGYHLTMVSTALLADMDYKITWKSEKNFDKKARIQQMQQLAASLGGGQSRVGLKSIESKGLALGIRTDPFLLALSVPEMNGMSEEVIRQADQERNQPVRQARADPSPDAPLVLPPGGYVMPTYDLVDD